MLEASLAHCNKLKEMEKTQSGDGEIKLRVEMEK